MNDSTLPERLRTLVTPQPYPGPFADGDELQRLARRFFVDCAYEDDPRLRQALRAAWVAGFRAGAAALREAD